MVQYDSFETVCNLRSPCVKQVASSSPKWFLCLLIVCQILFNFKSAQFNKNLY